ncbi:DUF1564 family protein [Leptospira ellisii]|uniref:DUF1564 family protein n=1 Tax=Leptospira ellisii TaxID=2023197 RepID=UPI000C2AE75E|nr:hypothetical protein CH375_17655 [Leptospira ellisii]
MGTIQLNDKNSTALSLTELRVTCSFLIPAKLLYKLPARDRKLIGKNLSFLMKKFETNLATSRRIRRATLTIRYQKSGKDLIKINARVNAEDWAQLSIFAASHSVSRCFLYCFLLELLHSNRNISTRRLKKENPNYIFLWDFDFKRKVLKRFLFTKPPIFYGSFENSRL